VPSVATETDATSSALKLKITHLRMAAKDAAIVMTVHQPVPLRCARL